MRGIRARAAPVGGSFIFMDMNDIIVDTRQIEALEAGAKASREDIALILERAASGKGPP